MFTDIENFSPLSNVWVRAATFKQDVMSKESFPFTSTSLRSLRLEQEFQDWEDARRSLAHRRVMSRAPLPAAPRPPRRNQQRIQEVRAAPPQVRCRDTAIHNTFMCGDMKGVVRGA
ncbi:hypothetical protein WMY93_003939 [Mugilogobius chulae]|uniref:Uncharacterized protein n=1 Tax=Mugilogobius chulae TaxID=88201 RepID=A0AAW0PY55_9GOBI